MSCDCILAVSRQYPTVSCHRVLLLYLIMCFAAGSPRETVGCSTPCIPQPDPHCKSPLQEPTARHWQTCMARCEQGGSQGAGPPALCPSYGAYRPNDLSLQGSSKSLARDRSQICLKIAGGGVLTGGQCSRCTYNKNSFPNPPFSIETCA